MLLFVSMLLVDIFCLLSLRWYPLFDYELRLLDRI